MRGPEPVVDRRTVWWIRARRRIVDRRVVPGDVLEPVRSPRSEQVCARRGDCRRQVLERTQVIQNPEATSIRRNHEIVERILDHESVYWRVGQIHLQRLPAIAVVDRHAQRVLRSEIKTPAPNRILANNVSIAQWTLRNPGDDQLPCIPEILRPLPPPIAVI